jgi:hypothetical protein
MSNWSLPGYVLDLAFATNTGFGATTRPGGQQLQLYWYYSDDSGGVEVRQVPEGMVQIGDVDMADGYVTVQVGDPNAVLLTAAGAQAHVVMTLRAPSGSIEEKVNWHMMVADVRWARGVASVTLHPFRFSSLKGPGHIGRVLLERCNWAFGGPQCLTSDATGCDKTLATCKSKKRNRLADDNTASIETSAAGWDAIGGATIDRITGIAYHGSASLRVVTTGANQGTRTSASGRAANPNGGGEWTGSVYLRAASGSPVVRVRLEWFDGSGNSLGLSSDYADATLGASWQRVSATASAPANCRSVAIRVLQQSASGATWYLDAAMLETTYSYLQQLPSPWCLPSDGNSLRFGGFSTAPKTGQVLRWLQSTQAPAFVVHPPLRPDVPANPPAPPAPTPGGGYGREPRRHLQPGPPNPPKTLPVLPGVPEGVE